MMRYRRSLGEPFIEGPPGGFVGGQIYYMAPLFICGGDDCPEEALPFDKWKPRYVSGPQQWAIEKDPCENPEMVRVNGVCTLARDVPAGALFPSDPTKQAAVVRKLINPLAADVGNTGDAMDLARSRAYLNLLRIPKDQLIELKTLSLRNLNVCQKNLAEMRRFEGEAIAQGNNQIALRFAQASRLEEENIKQRTEILLAFRRVLVMKYHGYAVTEQDLKILENARVPIDRTNLISMNGLGAVPLVAAIPPLGVKVLTWAGVALGVGLLTYATAHFLQKAGEKMIALTNAQEQRDRAVANQLDMYDKCIKGKVDLGISLKEAQLLCVKLTQFDEERWNNSFESLGNTVKSIATYAMIGAGVYITLPLIKSIVEASSKKVAEQ